MRSRRAVRSRGLDGCGPQRCGDDQRAVALNATAAPFPAPACMLCPPVPAPNVQTTLARPSESVTDVAELGEPLFHPGVQLTVTALSGTPAALRTRTVSGIGSAPFTGPDCASPATMLIEAGFPAP